jgi:hypothetical protein
MKESVPDDFMLGYFTHILTDIRWSETTYPLFGERYQQDVSPVQEKRTAYYNDTDLLDWQLYGKCSWRSEAWTLMEEAKGRDISGLIAQSEVEAWKIRTLAWYDKVDIQRYRPQKYLYLKDIERFMGDAGEQILCILQP